ncbi:hypothetical protein HPK10_01965 [Anoxybacillus flavithermus]|uniref:hypothetical protein n=1 Tax=Anoxybacillus flavithermus TaxID=33934 RepID=UPI0018678E07|nr:hypothetical protein [Anoxybacillus flavithermus]MBE2941959.1 hypothetical protein [Anoxybacillus flavithermus]MBE2950197.1 hypothetical protein [Anoxybacillus flavithermus]MBE2953006.1 hypothetical protein [Anoxybacillus flavithermus]MBE2958359.1 hypothetical protein [Anoxybacillus flavithermus]
MELTNDELAMLILHMSIMRKEIKKALKRNYGFFEAKKKMNVYDSILDKITSFNEKKTLHDIALDDEELSMLHAFLSSYTVEIERQAQKENMNVENSEVFQLLSHILSKVEGMQIAKMH